MGNLNSQLHAYPARGMYPMDTPEALDASYRAYTASPGVVPDSARQAVEANFAKAAAFYGVELPRPAEQEKRASLLLDGGGMGDVETSLIATREELDEAVDRVLEMRKTASRADLQTLATFVILSADAMGVSEETEGLRKVARIAGMGAGDRDEINDALLERAYAPGTDKGSRDLLKKLAADQRELSDEEFYTADNLSGLCAVMDMVDDANYGHLKTAAGVVPPEEVVFRHTVPEVADELDDTMMLPQLDTVISKTAALERADLINRCLEGIYGTDQQLEGEELLNKLASLDPVTLAAVLEMVQ